MEKNKHSVVLLSHRAFLYDRVDVCLTPLTSFPLDQMADVDFSRHFFS